MTVDVSAVARVMGITTQYKDLRGGRVTLLPQRIAVLAQGNTDAVYALTKFQALTAGDVATKMGYGSPAHLAMRMLKPANGDGVGTIPVTIYPLADGASAAAAAGAITPTGTQTKAAAYKVSINNILTDGFVIPKDATVTAACRLIHDALVAKLEMPVNATYTYGTVTAGALTGTGNGTLTAMSVTGTPKPGAWTLVVTSAVANGGVWKLVDPDGLDAATGLTQTVGAGGATVFNEAGLQFTITDGSTDFGSGASFTMTVPATAVPLTAKWKGPTGNDIYVEVIGEDWGITFAVTQPTGGLVNPSVVSALAQMGNVWETLVLNCLDIADTDVLDDIAEHGEGRWGTLVHKPYVAFTGNTAATLDDATAVCEDRQTDRINAQLVAPGSNDLPFVVAARSLARIAKVANNNPPTGYGAEQCTLLTPGADGDQWDYPTRDAAVKRGSSTTEVVDGVIELSDVVTFYRPSNEEPPAYRKVVGIVKLQNIIFNLSLIFAAKAWASAPMVPDDQVTVNPNARKPRDAKAAIGAMFDSLGLEAIISDVKGAKDATTVYIDSQNPDRLNVRMDATKLSGNSDIKDIILSFGFYFGGAPVAA